MTTKKLTPEAIILIAHRFKVLSEPIRLQILISLQDGEKSVNQLSDFVRSSQPNVSKHLKILQNAGILRRTQTGNTVFYSIADPTIFALCETVCGSLETKLKNETAILSAL